MTPRPAITPAGTPGELARAGLMGIECGARRAAPRQPRSNKQIKLDLKNRQTNVFEKQSPRGAAIQGEVCQTSKTGEAPKQSAQPSEVVAAARRRQHQQLTGWRYKQELLRSKACATLRLRLLRSCSSGCRETTWSSSFEPALAQPICYNWEYALRVSRPSALNSFRARAQGPGGSVFDF